MKISLQEFVNSKKATQEAYEYRNPYGPNMSQFEWDMAKGEEEVQEIQSPMAASSGKRKKSIVDKYFVPKKYSRSSTFHEKCISCEISYLESRYGSWEILL